jgi:hypothetical protein
MSPDSKVYFGSIKHGNPGQFASLAAKFDKIIDLLDFSTIKPKDMEPPKRVSETQPSFF